MKDLVSILEASFFGLATLIAAIGLSWFVLVQANYGYSVWHDYGGIGDAIDEFGPQNRYKENFALTSKEQRVILFSQIVDSVHHNGSGLEAITYVAAGEETPLLREPEIIHLQDVARLINALVWAIYGISALLMLVITLYGVRRKKLPPLKTQIRGVALVVGFIALVIVLVGWEAFFAQFHIWVFPEENQWFFYYQDSLMSTMMWAPHLFNYIGMVWVLLTALFFAGFIYLQGKLNGVLAAWINSKKRYLKRPE